MPRFGLHDLEIDVATDLRLQHARAAVPWRRLFEHYGLHWQSDSPHQLSCPIHARYRDADGRPIEHNPSAHLYQDGRIYCFACAEGGDVVWLFSRLEKVPFHVALDRFYQTFGLTAPDPGRQIQLLQDRRKVAEKVVQDDTFDLTVRRQTAVVMDAIWTMLLRHPAERDRIDRVMLDLFGRLYDEFVPRRAATAIAQWRQIALDMLTQLLTHILEVEHAGREG